MARDNLTWIDPTVSGLDIRGEIRDIIEIPGKNSNSLLFLQNNDFPVLYQLKNKIKKKKKILNLKSFSNRSANIFLLFLHYLVNIIWLSFKTKPDEF